jgi:hypothetical protein
LEEINEQIENRRVNLMKQVSEKPCKTLFSHIKSSTFYIGDN